MARKNKSQEEDAEMTNEEVMTDAPEVNGEDEGKWELMDGTAASKSAFIREQFTKGNKSRKQISEEYEIPYRTVYGATVNMENAAEPTSRGRGLTFSKIQVTAANEVVFVKDGVTFVNGEALPDGSIAPDTTETDRNTWIKAQVAAGVSRGDIAKALDLSYGVVYGLTKEAEGVRQKYEVTDPDSGEVISRSEYIRRRVAAGVSKAEIAKALAVEYSVVWQATKKLKTVEEKFSEAIAALQKFMDASVNPDVITKAIALLETVTIKEDKKDMASEDDT